MIVEMQYNILEYDIYPVDPNWPKTFQHVAWIILSIIGIANSVHKSFKPLYYYSKWIKRRYNKDKPNSKVEWILLTPWQNFSKRKTKKRFNDKWPRNNISFENYMMQVFVSPNLESLIENLIFKPFIRKKNHHRNDIVLSCNKSYAVIIVSIFLYL